MNKSFLDIMFFPEIETKLIGKKTIYRHPKITFFIENHDCFDTLGFDNQLFYYKRPQKEIVNNNKVFLKIHEDLNILFKISFDDYHLHISEIFEDIFGYNKFHLSHSRDRFILQAYYLGERRKYPNNKTKIYEIDNELIDPKKMKILEHGYIFINDLFMPMSSGMSLENPFFKATHHNQIKFFEKMQFLNKNHKKFI